MDWGEIINTVSDIGKEGAQAYAEIQNAINAARPPKTEVQYVQAPAEPPSASGGANYTGWLLIGGAVLVVLLLVRK